MTCIHEHAEPVEVRDPCTGDVETVAAVCTRCLERLPAAWGCPDCEWVEDRRLCDPIPQRMLATPCRKHA